MKYKFKEKATFTKLTLLSVCASDIANLFN